MLKKTINICKISLFLLVPIIVCAQSHSIKGRVIDNKNQPIGFTTIELSDSIDIGNALSDKDGFFEIKDINTKNVCQIKISCLGFEPYIKEIIINEDINLGNIILLESTITLGDVLITGKMIENFSDRTVYRLSEIDRNSFISALDAVRKIIPKIIEGADNNLSTVMGEHVKILINGINSSESDLAVIVPKDILKIEYFENPPARYANLGLGAVVNVITKKRNNGGTVAVNFQNAVTTGFGNDLANINYNHDNTQIGFKYNLNYRQYNKRVLNETLAYSFQNSDYEENKIGLSSPYKYQTHQFELYFICMKENNYTLSANLSLNEFDQDRSNQQEITQQEPILNDYIADGFDKNKYTKPAIDLYINKMFSKNQDITINVVGSYYDSKMNNQYHEYNNEPTDTIFYSNTKVSSNKYSIISDAVYTYSLGINKLTFGVRNSLSRSKQKLTATIDENLSSNLNELYAYSELTGRLEKITYVLSGGVNYNYFNSYELEKKYSNLYFRPSLNIGYQKNQNSELSFNYQINSTNPSISELSNNPVMQDVNIAFCGNPNLKPFITHSLLLSYNFNNDYVLIMPEVSFSYSKNPILPFFVNQQDYLLQTFENLYYSKRYNLSAFAQWFPFKTKWLRLRIYGEWFRDEAGYNGKKWFNNNYGLIPSMIMNYKKWNMNFFYQSKIKTLDGQLLNYLPSMAYIEISYKPMPQMTALVGLRYPFYEAWEKSTETSKSALISRFTTEKIINNANMVYVQFVYNLTFGKQLRLSKKKLNNTDDDSGILIQK